MPEHQDSQLKVALLAPESDTDAKVVTILATKIFAYLGKKCEITTATKQAYLTAVKKEGDKGLEKVINIYLRKHQKVIFVLDSDGIESQVERNKQPNSLLNLITRTVDRYDDRVLLILAIQEIEAWLLIDCLGICCYFMKQNVRKDKKWINFIKKHQPGKTDRIAEAVSGGNSAKEYLVKLSEKILIKKILI